jgi:hypothetical protein
LLKRKQYKTLRYFLRYKLKEVFVLQFSWPTNMSTFSNENHVTRGFTSDAINEFAFRLLFYNFSRLFEYLNLEIWWKFLKFWNFINFEIYKIYKKCYEIFKILKFWIFWKFWPFFAIWLADWKWNLVSGWTTLKHRIENRQK